MYNVVLLVDCVTTNDKPSTSVDDLSDVGITRSHLDCLDRLRLFDRRCCDNVSLALSADLCNLSERMTLDLTVGDQERGRWRSLGRGHCGGGVQSSSLEELRNDHDGVAFGPTICLADAMRLIRTLKEEVDRLFDR